MRRLKYGPGHFRGRAKSAPEVLNGTAAELGFMKTVIELFEWRGWRVFHSTDSLWDTAFGETAKGFLDIIALRSSRLVVAELKTEQGTLTPEQLAWFGLWDIVAQRCDAAGIKGVVEVHVWRPRDIDTIHEIAK